MPKMDDFYIKVLPLMEELKKLQRQSIDQVRLSSLLFVVVSLTIFPV
jgi:hypothetical protein